MARRDGRTGERDREADAIARAAERLSEKLERKAADLDRHVAKIAEQAERLDRASDRLASIDLWMRSLGATRKPRFTHDDVRVAAMRVADAEGIDALSMRRVAAELDAPTMTLYHYVRTKDELLSLIRDAVMAEVVLPPEEVLPAVWKEAMVVIATRTRDVMLRHPWVTSIDEGPSIGPSSVRHFDQSLQALAQLEQPFNVKIDILTAVDEYVFGYCRHLVVDEAVWEELPGLSEYVTRLLADGTNPQVQAAVDELGIDGWWAETQGVFTDPDRFLRNLRRLLDGIERSL